MYCVLRGEQYRLKIYLIGIIRTPQLVFFSYLSYTIFIYEYF